MSVEAIKAAMYDRIASEVKGGIAAGFFSVVRTMVLATEDRIAHFPKSELKPADGYSDWQPMTKADAKKVWQAMLTGKTVGEATSMVRYWKSQTGGGS